MADTDNVDEDETEENPFDAVTTDIDDGDDNKRSNPFDDV